MTDPRLVLTSIAGGVATITLNSPHNRNALSVELRHGVIQTLAAANADPQVRVVVLAHSGPVFCSGLDLKQDPGSSGAESQPTFAELLTAVWDSPKPVIAQLRGAARAGGMGLLAACDLAVATDAVTFAFTEVRLGVVPSMISVTVLARMLPPAAHELMLTAEPFGAARALRVGLLNSVVPEAVLTSEVRRYTDLLSLGAPGAMSLTKALLRETYGGDIGLILALRALESRERFESAEGTEGVRAFLEKRPPSWVLATGSDPAGRA